MGPVNGDLLDVFLGAYECNYFVMYTPIRTCKGEKLL